MRHCEERSDEAIQSDGDASRAALDCFACARNDEYRALVKK
jgi:hypothetical protein